MIWNPADLTVPQKVEDSVEKDSFQLESDEVFVRVKYFAYEVKLAKGLVALVAPFNL